MMLTCKLSINCFLYLIARARKVDLSKCQCNEVLSIVYPQLVIHWKASKNKLKTFSYLIESAAALIAVNSNVQALSHLSDVQAMIHEAEANIEDDSMFFICTEDKARVEFLKGQVRISISAFFIDMKLTKASQLVSLCKIIALA